MTMDEKQRDYLRYFLKDHVREKLSTVITAQRAGKLPPPIQKPYDCNSDLIDLKKDPDWSEVAKLDISEAIRARESVRSFSDKALTLEELSYLLWATQGIRKHLNVTTAFRTVPSAGSRHAFETYLAVLNVEGLKPGIYRFLPVEHKLLFEFEVEDLSSRLVHGTRNQHFVGEGAVSFIWTTIPERMEWRYDLAAHKVIALDAGHLCQNLYLACQAVGCGTCAIAAYDQTAMDKLLELNEDKEFVIYLAPVGKVA